MGVIVEPRRSARGTKMPERFRPSSADLPAELQSLIRESAQVAASKSKVPFESGAVVALEEALEPMLESLCEAALAHATKEGREEILEADLKAVSSRYMAKVK